MLPSVRESVYFLHLGLNVLFSFLFSKKKREREREQSDMMETVTEMYGEIQVMQGKIKKKVTGKYSGSKLLTVLGFI